MEAGLEVSSEAVTICQTAVRAGAHGLVSDSLHCPVTITKLPDRQSDQQPQAQLAPLHYTGMLHVTMDVTLNNVACSHFS